MIDASPYTLRTPDGVNLACRRWDPEGDPVGVVQIAHGLAEHCARYQRFASFLAERGWLVIAHDHRGHGSTAQSDAELGHFADDDGWSRAVEDVASVLHDAWQAKTGVPVVLFGHSMGSSIALSALARYPGLVDAAVLSGPTGVVGPLRRIGLVLTRLERLRLGRRGRSALLHKLSFDGFNKAFEPARTPFDWLSRDPTEVDAYVADPKCGFVVTTQHWHDHLVALGDNARVEHLARIPKALPIRIFAGRMDPVSKGGKQLDTLLDRMKAAGLTRADAVFYEDGRHELLNDINRDAVTEDIHSFLEAQRG